MVTHTANTSCNEAGNSIPIQLLLSLYSVTFKCKFMANTLSVYSNTKFKMEVIVDREHCSSLTKRSEVNLDEIALTIHIPFEQLNSWKNIKQKNIG